MATDLIWNVIIHVYNIYICLFHTHMVYCYIMTNIIMNTHNNNNNKRYNKILKSADSISGKNIYT